MKIADLSGPFGCTCGVPRLRGFKGFLVSARLWNQQLARSQRHQEFEEQPILVDFESVAEALRSQGKVRESLAATRDLIALHPKESVHHLQMSTALLHAGMGEAAREEARQAVKLEPSSALAQKILAEILENDAIGRKFREGSDYPGAAVAFRAAARLDPEDKSSRGNLAILLEYDTKGQRYGTDAPLKDAIAEYQKFKPEELKDLGIANNLPYVLFYARQFAEARQNAESLNPQPTYVLIAAEAALHGSQAAIAEARKRSSKEDELKPLLRTAGEMLLRGRQYAMAADLLEAGASGSEAARVLGLAALARKMTPHESMTFPDDPAGLAKRVTLELTGRKLKRDELSTFYSRNALRVVDNTDPEELEASYRSLEAARRSLVKSGYPLDVMLDIVAQGIDAKAAGSDATGYRVSLRGGNNLSIMYVIKEQGYYKVLDTSVRPNAIALEILDRVQAGDLKGARALLDWAREDQHLDGGDDPLDGFAFPRMWTKGNEGTETEMRVAAAALLCQTPPTAKQGVELVRAAFPAVKDEAQKLNMQLALLDGYNALEQFGEEYDLATELAKTHADSKKLFLAREFALRKLKRFPEVDALAEGWLKKQPDDVQAQRSFFYSAKFREDYVLARERGLKILESGRAEADDYNSVAWYSLFTGKPADVDLENATKAVQLGPGRASTLHTLGCVYAALGKTKEAREVFLQAMEILNMEEPDGNYWYGFGRIAEDYGETAVAASYYKKVEKPKKEFDIPGSSYRLAQMRLMSIEKR